MLKDALGSIYTDMLNFHLKVYKLINSNHPRGLQETKSLGENFQPHLDGILKSLRKHGATIDTEMENVRIQEQIQTSKLAKMQQTTAWLTGDDASQDLRLERQIQKPSDSIGWFTCLPETIRWEANDATEPILWLHGRKAGMFKPRN